MNKFLLAVAAAASFTTAVTSVPAFADPGKHHGKHGDRYDDYGRHDDRGKRHWNRGNHGDRANGRDWRRYQNYDYNRVDPNYGNYYADRYYRDGRYYEPRQLSRNDRIYRGSDDRYYCRRSDGTTGLIIGGAVGGLLGRSIDRGGSRAVGTIIGAGAGALLGREVDRGGMRCR